MVVKELTVAWVLKNERNGDLDLERALGGGKHLRRTQAHEDFCT